jgi:hypothetical protein
VATVHVRVDRLRPIAFHPTVGERRLRWSSAAVAVLHAVQAALVLALSEPFSLPVTASFPDGPPGTAPAPVELFSVALGPAVAAILALAAAFHALVASPWGFPRYVRELRNERNRFRWVEHSASASLMIVLVALVTGISEVAALIALFGLNVTVGLFGWEAETGNGTGEAVVWRPFAMGCIAGLVPWVVIGVYLWAPTAGPPGFVYGMVASLFVLYHGFAVNQWLQYRRIGWWRRYQVGEAAYVVLSLTAKSALAWQLFANLLAGTA